MPFSVFSRYSSNFYSAISFLPCSLNRAIVIVLFAFIEHPTSYNKGRFFESLTTGPRKNRIKITKFYNHGPDWAEWEGAAELPETEDSPVEKPKPHSLPFVFRSFVLDCRRMLRNFVSFQARALINSLSLNLPALCDRRGAVAQTPSCEKDEPELFFDLPYVFECAPWKSFVDCLH
ncbi:hypothetical protein GWI33_004405 [Rhynchophorus ferrugineus]|uniref:Uncharacterized protein n=1 Tax=Rhynchophorus ferrugineus TaxID=354439 RepID=A0A834MKG9_RHYFE|nr:hypothetical protein GWI33_004405 [Rhynchophorus ferrugineus]